MSITLARMSFVSSMLSFFALVLSWLDRLVFENHDRAIVIFVLAFIFSIVAVGAGILGIRKVKDERERRKAWAGVIVGSILFLSMGAVVVILLVIWISGNMGQ